MGMNHAVTLPLSANWHRFRKDQAAGASRAVALTRTGGQENKARRRTPTRLTIVGNPVSPEAMGRGGDDGT
jgi:hypothetical protein